MSLACLGWAHIYSSAGVASAVPVSLHGVRLFALGFAQRNRAVCSQVPGCPASRDGARIPRAGTYVGLTQHRCQHRCQRNKSNLVLSRLSRAIIDCTAASLANAQEWPFLVTADEFGPFFAAMGTRRPALVLGHILRWVPSLYSSVLQSTPCGRYRHSTPQYSLLLVSAASSAVPLKRTLKQRLVELSSASLDRKPFKAVLYTTQSRWG